MKKVLFVLCAMLLAGAAYADELQQTPPPVIYWEVYGDHVSIYAIGDGEVLLYDDFGNLVSNPFDVARLMYFEGDFDMTVMATAQIEGWLISEPVYETVHIPALEKPEVPVPTFECVEEDAGIWVYAVAEDPVRDEVWLYLDTGGEVIANPYYLEKRNEGYYVNFQAMTIRDGVYDSDWAFYTVVVPALDPPVLPDLPEPYFTSTEDDFYITITAMCPDSRAEVSLFVEDVNDCTTLYPIDNPYVLAKAYIEQRFNLKAVAHLEGYNDSESWEHFVVSSFYQQAPEPVVNMEQGIEGCTVTLVPVYESLGDIYWRYCRLSEGNDWSDWMIYDEPIHFNDEGEYMIEAYVAENDLWAMSNTVTYIFYVTPPDYFIVDGIRYKRTGNGTAAVTAFIDYQYGYGYFGDIVIPSTVTYKDVTYMVTAIEDNAFNSGYDAITSVEIGAYVTAIGNGAFKNCSGLNKVTLGDYVISIGDEAFEDCYGLTSVTIGSGVRSIGYEAFAGCNSLETVICKPAVPPVMADSDCFDCYNTATLHVFPAVLNSYKSTFYWVLFTNIVGEDNVVPSVGDANGDGEFNVSDVIQLINMLLNSN